MRVGAWARVWAVAWAWVSRLVLPWAVAWGSRLAWACASQPVLPWASARVWVWASRLVSPWAVRVWASRLVLPRAVAWAWVSRLECVLPRRSAWREERARSESASAWSWRQGRGETVDASAWRSLCRALPRAGWVPGLGGTPPRLRPADRPWAPVFPGAPSGWVEEQGGSAAQDSVGPGPRSFGRDSPRTGLPGTARRPCAAAVRPGRGSWGGHQPGHRSHRRPRASARVRAAARPPSRRRAKGCACPEQCRATLCAAPARPPARRRPLTCSSGMPGHPRRGPVPRPAAEW